MATIRSYTTIEQSRKLAEILSLESADMHYFIADSLEKQEINYAVRCGTPIVKTDIPCWSLAALFNYLREIDFFPNIEVDEHSISMSISYYDEEEARPLAPVHNVIVEADTFVDACVAMIEKLYEQKIL